MAGKGKIKILRREEKIKRRVNILIYCYQYTLRSCSFPDRFPLNGGDGAPCKQRHANQSPGTCEEARQLSTGAHGAARRKTGHSDVTDVRAEGPARLNPQTHL